MAGGRGVWLAISTAHEACSAALIDDDVVLRQDHLDIGRGHDSRLAPMVRDLLAQAGRGRPQAVVVDVGPGSFTGIRVGVAMARGLGLGWGVPVHGCASDRIVAAAVFRADPSLADVLVLLDGRRGELFARAHQRQGAIGEPVAVGRAEARALARDAAALAGPLALMAEDWGAAPRLACPPSAAACRWLAQADRTLPPAPIYVRQPDAKRASC